MILIAIGIGYIFLLAFVILFFRAVHRWDDEIQKMEKQTKPHTGKQP
jgi:hypothetical protein